MMTSVTTRTRDANGRWTVETTEDGKVTFRGRYSSESDAVYWHQFEEARAKDDGARDVKPAP